MPKTKRKRETEIISEKESEKIEIKSSLKEEIKSIVHPRQNNPANPAPLFIKVFVLCHAGLNINTVESDDRRVDIFETPSKRKNRSFKYTQDIEDNNSIVTLNVNYSDDNVNIPFEVKTVYVDDLKFFLNTPGTYAGLPTCSNHSNFGTYIERVENFFLQHKNVPCSDIISDGLDISAGPLQKKVYMQKDSKLDYVSGYPIRTMHEREKIYDESFRCINNQVSLLVDKQYQTISRDLDSINSLKGKSLGSNACRIVMTVGMQHMTQDYILLPFYEEKEFEDAKIKLSLENPGKVEEYFEKIKNSHFIDADGNNCIETSTSDIIKLLENLYNLENTRIEFYDASCCDIETIDFNPPGKRTSCELRNVSKLLEVVNTYLRGNGIAFGKHKRTVRKRKSNKNHNQIGKDIKKNQEERKNVLRKMQLRNNKQK